MTTYNDLQNENKLLKQKLETIEMRYNKIALYDIFKYNEIIYDAIDIIKNNEIATIHDNVDDIDDIYGLNEETFENIKHFKFFYVCRKLNINLYICTNDNSNIHLFCESKNNNYKNVYKSDFNSLSQNDIFDILLLLYNNLNEEIQDIFDKYKK